MKRPFYSFLSALLISLLLSGCGRSVYAGPEKAVRSELDLIQQMDETVISSFLSTNISGLTVDEDVLDATKMLFENFKYDIISSKQEKDGGSASVKVAITNIDAKKLAKDLCREMIANRNLKDNQITASKDLLSYFKLMKKCLKENTYPTQKTYAVFELTNDSESTTDNWIINPTEKLADELVGGLIGCLNDSDLLKPEEVLDITLNQFRNLQKEEWKEYLNISNIFSVESASYQELDLLLVEKLSDVFDYEILSAKQDGDAAYINVKITGIDLNAVVSEEQKKLLDYAHTLESVRATDDDLANKSFEILKQSLLEHGNAVTTETKLYMKRNDYLWEPVLDQNFTNALFGNPNSITIQTNQETDPQSEQETS